MDKGIGMTLALYPGLAPGSSGLTKASFALVDHLRSIDKRRIRRIFGQVSPSELADLPGFFGPIVTGEWPFRG